MWRYVPQMHLVIKIVLIPRSSLVNKFMLRLKLFLMTKQSKWWRWWNFNLWTNTNRQKTNSANTKLGWEWHYLLSKWIWCKTWSQSRIVLNWTFSLTDKNRSNYLSCILKKNYKNRLWKKQISTCPSERSTSITKSSRIEVNCWYYTLKWIC